MSDITTYPNWEAYPCLDDVITKDDVSTKGGGNFAADYVNHMKTSQLLRQHARGWDFELKTFVDADGVEHDCWRAPDGTAYVKGFFRAPAGSGFMDTPPMSQAIMDNRNAPVAWEKVSSRDVTDTERRCMCTAAARHFGLAWQLWAKVAIEDPMDESTRPEKPVKAPAKAKAAAPKADMPAQPEKKPASSPVAGLQQQVEKVLRPLFNEAVSTTRPRIRTGPESSGLPLTGSSKTKPQRQPTFRPRPNLILRKPGWNSASQTPRTTPHDRCTLPRPQGIR